MSKIIKRTVLVLLLYIFFYTPAFTVFRGIPSIVFLYPLVFVGLFTGKGLRLILPYFRKECRVLLFLLVYVFFRTMAGGESSFFIQQLLATMNVFVVPLSIILLFDGFKVSQQQFIRYLLVVGVVGALISCLCLFMPSLNNFVRFSLLAEERNAYLQTHMYRGFGIANSLTSASGYPSALAIITCFGLFYRDTNKWFLLFIPFMVIAILVNARTAFIVLVLGVVLLLFVERSGRLKVLVSLGIVFLFAVFLINKVEVSDYTIDWIRSFFEEFNFYFKTQSLDGTTAGAIVEEHVFFPEKLSEWIFGTGDNIFLRTEERSDVGFIRQLFYGGIIFLLLEAFLIWIICKKSCGIVFPGFVALLLLSLAIFHFKGIFIPTSAGFRVFVLVYYYMYYHSLSRGYEACNGRMKKIVY